MAAIRGSQSLTLRVACRGGRRILHINGIGYDSEPPHADQRTREVAKSIMNVDMKFMSSVETLLFPECSFRQKVQCLSE